MLSVVALFFIISFSTINAQYFNLSREARWPSDLISPFPYHTYAPINIDTETVRVINTSTPLRLNAGLFEPHNVINTGYSVRLTVNNNILPSLTGGVLGSCLYVFHDLNFFWARDQSSIAGMKIDGVGTPLFASGRFRNSKYPNAAVANAHRDGFAIIVFNINVEGYYPNPLFNPFEKILSGIVRAGSVRQGTTLPVFGWFDQLTNVQNYYSYPGTFIDLGNLYRPQYESATIIQMPKLGSPYISIPQFQYFLKLLSPTGTPITNVLSPYPRGSRPVVQAGCLAQDFLPTAA